MGAAWLVYVCVCILTKIVRFGQEKPRNFNFSVERVLRTVWNGVAVHDPLLVWVKIASTSGLQGPIGVNRA